MQYPPVQNYINGVFVDASTSRSLNVVSPLDGKELSKVPMSTPADLNYAVSAAKDAFPKWSKMPIKERVQVFFRYKFLLEKNLRELANLVHEENLIYLMEFVWTGAGMYMLLTVKITGCRNLIPRAGLLNNGQTRVLAQCVLYSLTLYPNYLRLMISVF